MRSNSPKSITLTALAGACLLACLSAQAATIVISSRDAPGVGFNDPTVVAPVGGNPKTTLGEQRMFVYRHVADLWEAAISSPATITVNAGWEALTCTASSATLGSAGAWNFWHDFSNGTPNRWYPQALANKIYGSDLSAGQPDDGSGYGNVDIKTQFNINLGNTGCLDGLPFYLGVDGNAGSKVNFVTTLLHELGHGLGFAIGLTSTASGRHVSADGSAYVTNGGVPSFWEDFMFDNTVNKSWVNMTDAERTVSAINPLKLAWTGVNAVAGALATLKPTPVINVATTAPGATGKYDYATASFGAALPASGNLGTLATIPAASNNELGCNAFDAASRAAVFGKVALISRGTCGFVVKVKNAQDAGATAVLIKDNAPGAPAGLGGSDPTITIPSARITQAAGITLSAAVAAAPAKVGSRGTPGNPGVVASLGTDPTRIAGADSLGRPLLYTPNPRIAGSSVSHWDVSATPNLLMEPSINSDLTKTLVPPKDLTVPLLKDVGW